MTDVAPLPPGVTLDGDRLHVAPLGSPEQDNATAEVKLPPAGFTVTVTFTDWPCFTAAELGLTPTEKSTPVPPRLTACGLPEPLSVMLRIPDWAPAALGRKAMETVQVPVGASDDGQLLLCKNGPDTLMPEIASVVLPVLVIVIICAALVVPTSCAPKLKLPGDTAIEGCAVSP